MGNQCIYMAQNGDKIMNVMTVAMTSKLRDPTNQRHLQDTSVQMKQILKPWFGIMRTVKSKEYQTNKACVRFKNHTIALKNKSTHLSLTLLFLGADSNIQEN